MKNWPSRIEEYRKVSLDARFLTARVQGEQKARDLLNSRLGQFNNDDLEQFLDHCNNEHVPLNVYTKQFRDIASSTRFQRSFVGNNRVLMVEYLREFNEWIPILWKSDNVTDLLDKLMRRKTIKGAGSSLPTMIMYLKCPEAYSIWFRSLSISMGAYDNETYKTYYCVNNYYKYNNAVNESLRATFNLKPQEIDYILYRIGIDNNNIHSLTTG